jgi:disulfide bond formation protein DsbB
MFMINKLPAELRARVWFLLVAVICASLLGYALYVQHAMFLDPCPLCIFQRVAFLWIGSVALLAALHNPTGAVRWVYTILVLLGCATGAAIAVRHVWLQNLPPDQVPECGMGLNYMLDTMPFADVLRQVFYGSGECAQIDWTFAGLSMPAWTLVWYILIALVTLAIVISGKSRPSQANRILESS